MRWTMGAAVAATLTMASPAAAAIITLKVGGTVSRTGLVGSGFNATEALTGTVQYDTSSVAYQTGPYGNGSYAYYTLIGGSFLIHGLTYAFNSSGTFSVIDTSNSDSISFSQANPVGPTVGGYTPSYLALSFNGPALVSNNGAPQTTAAFTSAGSPYFQLWFNGGYTQGLTGYVSLVSAATAPEPASWLMMIVGFGAIGGVVRRRPAGARKAVPREFTSPA